jgi:hypothetical protein
MPGHRHSRSVRTGGRAHARRAIPGAARLRGRGGGGRARRKDAGEERDVRLAAVGGRERRRLPLAALVRREHVLRPRPAPG